MKKGTFANWVILPIKVLNSRSLYLNPYICTTLCGRSCATIHYMHYFFIPCKLKLWLYIDQFLHKFLHYGALFAYNYVVLLHWPLSRVHHNFASTEVIMHWLWFSVFSMPAKVFLLLNHWIRFWVSVPGTKATSISHLISGKMLNFNLNSC